MKLTFLIGSRIEIILEGFNQKMHLKFIVLILLTSLVAAENVPCLVDDLAFPGLVKGLNSSFRDGEVFEFKCDPRYKEANVKQFRCEDGNWIGPIPPCIAGSCMQPVPTVENAKAEVSSRTHLSVVKYVCEEPYFLVQKSQVQCLFSEWKGDPPRCEIGICYLKDLQKAENIAPVTPNVTLSGDHLKVTCEEGYTTRPVIPLCLHGKWNRNSISPCKEMTCNEPPPKVTNAMEEVIYRHRTVMRYRCKEPYILEGPSQIDCLFGEWRGQLPICTDKNCADAPPSVIHATVEIISTPQNKLAKYVCKEPYLLVGNSEMRCLLGGWNGTAPMCTDSRCYINYLPTEENLAEGAPIATNSGEKLNATCKVGYTLDEERPVCQNGTWINNSFPICKKSTCSIPNIDHGEVLEEYKGEYYFNLTKLQYDRNIMHIKMPIGRIVSPGTSYTLLCHKGHVVQGKSVHTSDISCKAGMWLPEPVCVFDMKCKKLNETDLLSIYYTDDRKIGSFAFFHCRSSGKRIDEPFARCLGNASWSKSEPTCEIRCEKPLPPERGSVQFSDGQAVGSMATYLCEEGTTLVGVSSSKCQENGVWTFDPPKCLRSCIIPEIENGVIGFYKTVQKYQRTYHEFVQFQVGETVKPGESVVLRCQDGFIPVNLTTSLNGDAGNIWCREGVWSKLMQCAPSKCLGDPPPMENGTPVVQKNTNGSSIWYKCNHGFEKLKKGHVECVYGTWKGYTSVCGDSRCFINSLNYPGLRLPTKEYLTSSRYFDINCEEGYVKTSYKKKIRCFIGKWDVESNPCAIINRIPKCSIERLRQDLPEDVSADLRNVTEEYVPYGTELQLVCNPGSFLSGSSKTKCGEQGRWEHGNVRCIQACILGETRSPLLIDPVKDHYTFGEAITLSCPFGHKLSSGLQRVMCLGTSWSDSIPDCVKVI